ncbi:MAG: molecular chaperone DnaJ [Patescibacteria group bacterium]
MAGKDYYNLLGITKSASEDEIKRAYKKLAVKYHPDVNKDPGAEAKFKEINEAYQVLSDPKKKSTYDQFGTADFNGGGAGFGGGGFDFSGFSGGGESFGGFEDIFDAFFGGQQKRSRGELGRDIEIIVPLSFEESVFGSEKSLSYSVLDTCQVCHGAGGEDLVTCTTCRGSGQVTKMARTILGSFQQASVCTTCHGTGHTPQKMCRTCHGQGATRQAKEITVTIPSGVDDGAALRVAGRGEMGPGGHGDLYLRLKVEKHRQFQREGDDIISSQTIPISLAVLGGTIGVETVHGSVELKIPAGTLSHTRFILKNKGVPRDNRSHKGDHIVTVIIQIPKHVSGADKEAFEALRKSGN